MSMTAAAMVVRARRQIENLEPAELDSELSRGGDLVLVDLREEDELRIQGQIQNSVWAPRGMLEFWADSTSPHHRDEFDPERRVVLYCASGGRSALAAETLILMGYRNVAHLDGGIAAWKDQGYSVDITVSRGGRCK